MITRIEAYRYRCFQKLALDVRPYQVLVGKNGAGKSTLLDLPILLGEILEARSISKAFLESTRSQQHPRAENPIELIYNQTGYSFSFVIEAKLPDSIQDSIHRKRVGVATKAVRQVLTNNPARKYSHIRYELSIRVKEDALSISAEHLILLPENRRFLRIESDTLIGEGLVENSSGNVRFLIERDDSDVARIKPEVKEYGRTDLPNRYQLKPQVPALSGMPLDVELYSASQWFCDLLTNQSRVYQPDLDKLRDACSAPGRDWTVAPDASTLAWSIKQLSEVDPDGFSEWLENISFELQLLSNITTGIREDDKRAYFSAAYGDDRKVSASGLSDGTLSILALTILPFLRNLPQMLTIEEPENGIHPKAIEIVLEALRAVEHSQLWVTTHSPIAVAQTELDDLLCLRKTGDGVVVERGVEHRRLRNWQGSPSLATLQSAGVL
ncbi:AAA family ATPase [Roseibacillus persicicus]|uniref:methylation-associated defense system AAA family ATPase MAD3 n=1 Tax=Roseibacillus persicicus TaxID=454148 RepID=UPI00398AC3CC